MNGRANGHRAGTVFRRNVSELMHDVLELGELQCQLFALDVSEARGRSILPIVLMLAALVLVLGTVPVALQSIVWVLVGVAGMSEAAACAVTAAGALLVAGGAGWLGWRKLSSAVNTLSRSKAELATNVGWIKDALKHRHAGTSTSPEEQLHN